MSTAENIQHVSLDLMAHGQTVESVDDSFRAYSPVVVAPGEWLQIPQERYIDNPGYLKLDLMTKGIRIDPELRGRLLIRPEKDSARGIGSGIDLLLPQEIWVNVPVQESFAQESTYRLQQDNSGWVLDSFNGHSEDCVSLRVEVPSKPAFAAKQTSTGKPMGDLAKVQGGYLIFGPRFLDDFWQKRLDEESLGPTDRSSGPSEALFSVDDMLEVAEAAFREGVAEHLFLSVGLTDEPDGGLQFLEPYIAAIKRHFDTLLRVSASPPGDEEWVDRGYALGIDSIAFNLEVFDIRTYQQVAPGRARRIRRDQYLERLARAARIYPNGAVLSHLILGLEPLETTLAGIKALCELGVLPTLSVFRPLLGTGLENWPSVETAQLAPVAAYLFRAVREHKISMTWVKSISNEITPIEGRFFTLEDAEAEVRRQNFFLSRTGSLLARNLSSVRRMLRVKTASDSFDSAGL